MMITQSINLNLIPGGVLPRINVSQYDKGSRTLQFVLFDGPVLYSIESGTEITIQGSKPDNTAFQYDCTWQGSTVSMDIEQQMTAVAGDVICELVISNNGEILGTCNFILNVESAAVSDDTVISETELPLIERAVEAAVEAAASAASAAQSAEDAAGYVETVETAAQSAAQSATDASSSAGTAQTAAQSAAQSATDASSSAGTAQTAAQNAAQSATDASGSASSASQSATDAAASAQAAAQSAASIGIATTSHAGIVKPDGTTITVDPDGTIHGNASVTVDSALSTTSTNPVQNKVITSALGKVEANIAPVETDPATSAWAVGRQIIFNDNLYEVIAAITAGDALVTYEDDPTNANIKLADPVEAQVTDISNEIANMNNVSGAKNFLPNDAISQTINGVTFTVNSDKSVTANGTATANSYLILSDVINIPSGEYILSGCPSGGHNSTYRLYCEHGTSYYDDGEGVTFNVIAGVNARFIIKIASGQTVSNLIFYPMLRPTSIKDGTYVPYAMTNKQITDAISKKYVYLGQKNITVYKDDTKTWAELLTELATALQTYCTNNTDRILNVHCVTISGMLDMQASAGKDFKYGDLPNGLNANGCSSSASAMQIYTLNANSNLSSSFLRRSNISTNTSVIDLSASVATNNIVARCLEFQIIK